jgi:hypothetical protein
MRCPNALSPFFALIEPGGHMASGLFGAPSYRPTGGALHLSASAPCCSGKRERARGAISAPSTSLEATCRPCLAVVVAVVGTAHTSSASPASRSSLTTRHSSLAAETPPRFHRAS